MSEIAVSCEIQVQCGGILCSLSALHGPIAKCISNHVPPIQLVTQEAIFSKTIGYGYQLYYGTYHINVCTILQQFVELDFWKSVMTTLSHSLLPEFVR